MKTRIILLALLAAIFLAGNASSQVLPFHAITMRDGLLSNSVSMVYQDSRGFLWFGTMDGISEFDGTRFKNYTTEDGLPFSRVDDIIESRKVPGTMWVATNGGGISRMANGSFTTYAVRHNQISNRVNVLLEDHTGLLWCGTDLGLFHLMGDSLVPVNSFFAKLQIEEMVEQGDSLIWLMANYKAYCYSLRSKTITCISDSFAKSVYVYRITPDRAGTIWLCQSDSTLRSVSSSNILRTIRTPMMPTSMIVDDNGDFWCGSETGVLHIGNISSGHPSFASYTSQNGLPDNMMYSGIADRENNLWFYTINKGVCELSNRSVLQFQTPVDVNYGNYASTALDSMGHIWVATGDKIAEYYRDNGGNWKEHLSEFEYDGKRYHPCSVQIDRSQHLWIRCFPAIIAELSVQHGEGTASTMATMRVFRQGKEFPNYYPFEFVIDDSNHLWMSLISCGLGRLNLLNNHEPVKLFGLGDGIIDTNLWTLYKDHNNRIWSAAYLGGLCVLDQRTGVFRRFTMENGLPDNSIRAIFEDSDGNIWIGTRYGGMAELDTVVRRTFTRRDGLFSNAVTSITEDAQQRLWIGTIAGVQYMPLSSPGSFYSNKELTGMNVFSCTAGPNDFIFASTTAGFLIYNSSIDKKNTIPPPVYLTNFQVNQKNVEFGSLLSFPYNRNNCLIDFVGVSMRDGGNMKYEYRLVPGDVKWQSTGGQRSVSFGALKPGHYRFSVKAINADGVASLAPAILEFTINPPYWLTWWFITAVLVLIASGVYLLISIREEQIIAVERVRSRIAADLHDDIGSGLIRIALLAEVIHRQVSEQKGEQRMERDAPAFGVSTTSLKVGTIARELVDAMNDVVWSVDPRNDSLERLIRRIEEYATELCDARGIAIAFTASAKDRSVKLGSQVVRCLLLVSKETVTNIVRHAECRNVSIDIRHEGSPGTITLLVRDDGKGFDAGQLPRVNGLDNMRQRAEKIGATFAISSGPGQGTAIEMEIPL